MRRKPNSIQREDRKEWTERKLLRKKYKMRDRGKTWQGFKNSRSSSSLKEDSKHTGQAK